MTKAVDVYAASFVKCCDAGKVAYPDPCPWHGTSDGMYTRLAEDPEAEWVRRRMQTPEPDPSRPYVDDVFAGDDGNPYKH